MPSNNSNFGTSYSQQRSHRVPYNNKIYACAGPQFSEFGCTEITVDNRNLNQIQVARGVGMTKSANRTNSSAGQRRRQTTPSRQPRRNNRSTGTPNRVARRRGGVSSSSVRGRMNGGMNGNTTRNSMAGQRRRSPMPPAPGPGGGGRRPRRSQYR